MKYGKKETTLCRNVVFTVVFYTHLEFSLIVICHTDYLREAKCTISYFLFLSNTLPIILVYINRQSFYKQTYESETKIPIRVQTTDPIKVKYLKPKNGVKDMNFQQESKPGAPKG